MIKRFALLLGTLVLVLGLSACTPSVQQPSQAESSSVEVKIPETTKVLKEDLLTKLTVVVDNPDIKSLTFDDAKYVNSTGLGIKPGDVIVAGVTEKTPFGLLKRVLGVEQKANQLIVRLTDASLEDAIERGEVKGKVYLTSSNIRSYSALEGVEIIKGPRSIADIYEPLAVLDGIKLIFNKVLYEGNGFSVRIDGSMFIRPVIDFTLSIESFKIKDSFIRVGVNENLNIRFTSFCQNSLRKEIEIARLGFAPVTFMVGSVPIVLTPSLSVRLGVNGQVYAIATAEVTQNFYAAVGVKGKSFDEFREVSKSFNYQRVSVDGNLSAIAYATVDVRMSVYGTLSVDGNLRGFLELTGTTNKWNLYAGLDFEGFVKGKILGESIIDKSWSLKLAKDLLAKQ